MVGAGAVAAHNPMLAEQPHVAGLAYRIGLPGAVWLLPLIPI